jgi:hypothetical protein
VYIVGNERFGSVAGILLAIWKFRVVISGLPVTRPEIGFWIGEWLGDRAPTEKSQQTDHYKATSQSVSAFGEFVSNPVSWECGDAAFGSGQLPASNRLRE